MKIAHTHLSGGLQVGIALEEADQFDLTYDGYNRSERGVTLHVTALTASCNMEDGEVIVKAHGVLRNKDGALGQRSRDQYLEEDQIPPTARMIIATEYAHMRDRISAVHRLDFK